MVTLGDSITEGYNASGFAKTQAPRNPSLCRRICPLARWSISRKGHLSNLEGGPHRRVDWNNSTEWSEKPDLVVIAFGMNDPVSSEQFQKTNIEILTHLQKQIPQADLIFVSGMNNNPIWRDPTKIPGFREALRGIMRPNVILADITTPWEKLLTRKNFSDLSGNNVNHPNDFGHRLYSEILFSLFISPWNPCKYWGLLHFCKKDEKYFHFFWTLFKLTASYLMTFVSLFQFSLCFNCPITPQKCGVFVCSNSTGNSSNNSY